MTDRGRIDGVLLATVVLLCLFGAIMVYSSSAIVATVESNSQTAYLRSLLPKLGLGTLVLLLLMNLPHQMWNGRLARWVLAASLLSLLALVLPLGLAASGRGTDRFLDLGVIQLQPAEFARIGLVLYLSSFIARNRKTLDGGWWGLRWPIVVIFTIAALVAKQPNLSSALLIAVIGFALLFLSGQSPVKLFVLGLTPLVLSIPFWHAYQYKRVLGFLGRGEEGELPYQVKQSLIALGSGGFTGQGLGEGLQKFLYLPFPHTDFILGVVGEELGFTGVLVLFSLFGVVIYRGLRIARLVTDPFSQLLAAGITLSLALNLIVHSAVVLGVGPVTGVPLPFISHGGSSLLVNMAAVGLLLSISRSIRSKPVSLRMTTNWAGKPTRAE